MRAPRTFLEGAAPGKLLELSGAAYHHLARVLRRSEGDPLVVFDGRGGVFKAQVEGHDPARQSMTVRIGEALPARPSSGAPLSLAVGIPRGEGFEVALRWASEMGLARMIPLLTARGVVKARAGEGAGRGGKLERWRKIAREAAEQCGRTVPLAVDAPIALEDLLLQGEAKHPSRWIAVPGGVEVAASGLLEALRGPMEGEVLILIGPEGGFTPEELDRSVLRGFQPVGFPTPVLRTPTAVAYLGALSSLIAWFPPPEDPKT